MHPEKVVPSTFGQLGLSPSLVATLDALGYQQPSPIQAKAIPELLAGVDLIGQAQTGTGKTAAFALPIIDRIDLANASPQAIVLTPTRELALQVSASFERYCSASRGLRVVSLYGGQSFTDQKRALVRGAHIVVGTPGRTMDHLRRGSLALDGLSVLVLDEADEMLRMGFIEDVEWILEQIPTEHQTALFSATMPPRIRAIAHQHFNNPSEVSVEAKNASASTIHQRYWLVEGTHKLDAISRILEVETTEGVLIFTRTKIGAVELAELLKQRDFKAGAINGDMLQPARERVIEQFKRAQLDVLVATDVAARGLDVDRISHVVNYDIPFDTEAYVHRIGRTGRAGRHGEAILFVARREQRQLRQLEAAIGARIERMMLPSAALVNQHREEKFKIKLDALLQAASEDSVIEAELAQYQALLEQFCVDRQVNPAVVASLLLKLYQGQSKMYLQADGAQSTTSTTRRATSKSVAKAPPNRFDNHVRTDTARDDRSRVESRAGYTTPQRKTRKDKESRNTRLDLFRIEVGRTQGLRPAELVAAIGNEAGLESKFIGRIQIFDVYSTIELPAIIPKPILAHLQKIRVAQCALKISRIGETGAALAPSSAEANRRGRGAENPPNYTQSKRKPKSARPAARKADRSAEPKKRQKRAH